MKKNREGRAKSFRDAENGFSRPTKKQGKRRTNPPFTATKPLFEARIRKKRISLVPGSRSAKDLPGIHSITVGERSRGGKRAAIPRTAAAKLRGALARSVRDDTGCCGCAAGPGRKAESHERQAPSKSGLRDDPAARKTLRHTAHGTGGNERPFAYAYDPKRTAGESRPAARGRGTGTDFEFSERLGSEVRNGYDGHFRHPSPQTLRAEAGRGSRPMPMRRKVMCGQDRRPRTSGRCGRPHAA